MLIVIQIVMRQAEDQPDSEARSTAFENWHTALLQVAVLFTIIFIITFALDFVRRQAWLITLECVVNQHPYLRCDSCVLIYEPYERRKN